ncbi:hypothetical protein [Clostridium thermobutyricum]|uniref:hypothetical protein n=1 Tax=Clostridium thermobutyricum TaxID=29372 RepID=UPI003F5289B6
MRKLILVMTVGISIFIFMGHTAHADTLTKYKMNNTNIIEIKSKSILLSRRKQRDIIRILNKTITLKKDEITYARSKTKEINNLLKRHKTNNQIAKEKINKISKNISNYYI